MMTDSKEQSLLFVVFHVAVFVHVVLTALECECPTAQDISGARFFRGQACHSIERAVRDEEGTICPRHVIRRCCTFVFPSAVRCTNVEPCAASCCWSPPPPSPIKYRGRTFDILVDVPTVSAYARLCLSPKDFEESPPKSHPSPAPLARFIDLPRLLPCHLCFFSPHARARWYRSYSVVGGTRWSGRQRRTCSQLPLRTRRWKGTLGCSFASRLVLRRVVPVVPHVPWFHVCFWEIEVGMYAAPNFW